MDRKVSREKRASDASGVEGDAEAAGEALQGVSGGLVGGPAPSDKAGGGTTTGGLGDTNEVRRDIDATDEWDAKRE